MSENILTSLTELSRYIIDPSKRIYYVYILSAVALAVVAFWQLQQSRSFISFVRFMFPKQVWLNRSTGLDVTLLVVNKLVKGLVFAPILLAMVPVAIFISDGLQSLLGVIPPIASQAWMVTICFTLLLFILDDLSRFALHWLLHKVPFLWELHKVHHSATVLTPFTIYRAHPLESYLFACRLALAQGVAIGIGYYLFGPNLNVYEVAGANIFVFAFNVMGSNLRHSHIWLSWGKGVEKWFISPAQHQLHHSDNPKHFDCNLGSALAIWDRMAGSLVIAGREKQDISLGLGQDFNGHQNLWQTYWQPVKGAVLSFVGRR